MYLGVDFGNGKIKLCALHLSPRRILWKSYPLDHRLGYREGVAQALGDFLLVSGLAVETIPTALVATSQSFSYPDFAAAHQDALAIFSELLPQARFVALDGTIYSNQEAQRFKGRECARFAGTKSLGTAFLSAKLQVDGLSLDTGTTSTDIIPILGGKVDPVSSRDPAGFHLQRMRSGRLSWIGLTATPLDFVTPHLRVQGTRYDLIPRLAFTEAVSALLGLVPPELAQRHAYGGMFPSRERALFQLAQALGGDRLLFPETTLYQVAEALHGEMIARVAENIQRVLEEVGPLGKATVSGLGRRAIAYPALLAAGFHPDAILDLDAILAREHLATASSAYGMALWAAEFHLGKTLPILP